MGGPIEQVTVDGYDMTWGTNTLGENFYRQCYGVQFERLLQSGPFYFTQLLLPALFTASIPENKSRVVNTSSASHIHSLSLSGSGLDFATFKDSPHRRKYDTYKLYGQSKLVHPAIASIVVFLG